MKKYLLVLYLIILIACNDSIYQEDNDNCITANPTKEDCAKVNLQISENYCCLSYIDSDKENAVCKYVDEEEYYTYTDSKYYALEKERIGFNCHNENKGYRGYTNCQNGESQDYTMIYECKNGNASLTNEIYTFSDTEKTVLNDENHCLAHVFEFTEDSKKTKEECSNALLTDQAKKAGITCALYEFTFTFKNKKNKEPRNSCYLLNPDSFKNEAKAIRELTNFAKSLLDDDEEENFENFQVSISDNADHSFSYDSTKGTLKNSDSNDNNANTSANTSAGNNSRLISFSKFLFLLLFISL